jgi:hypothetical protein
MTNHATEYLLGICSHLPSISWILFAKNTLTRIIGFHQTEIGLVLETANQRVPVSCFYRK